MMISLYIGAKLYDSNFEKITQLISKRDDFDPDINDLISIVISLYLDQNNAVNFVVTSSGVQTDSKCTPEGTDDDWNAVWESATSIDKDGWNMEMKIPYSALRFSTATIQDWGFNIGRHINKNNEWSNWNYANNQTGEFYNYYGILKGFSDIKPPVRLSFTPYVSSYAEKKPNENWGQSHNIGMDLKYGINESFTLDAILIPDFGQVQSDDEELNLSPYEIKYNEKRQFFTEGTELFGKGNIFYSRRIGSRPSGFYNVKHQLKENEKILDNPIETKLINAIKVSGRTKNGLGLGVFNAMTSQTEAEVKNQETDKTRKIETQGFTNFNLVVFDKLLAENSYFSVINTNVKREDFIANVTATEFKIADKKNNYAVNDTGAISFRDDNNKVDTGYAIGLVAGKLNGKFKYQYSLYIHSESIIQMIWDI